MLDSATLIGQNCVYLYTQQSRHEAGTMAANQQQCCLQITNAAAPYVCIAAVSSRAVPLVKVPMDCMHVLLLMTSWHTWITTRLNHSAGHLIYEYAAVCIQLLKTLALACRSHANPVPHCMCGQGESPHPEPLQALSPPHCHQRPSCSMATAGASTTSSNHSAVAHPAAFIYRNGKPLII